MKRPNIKKGKGEISFVGFLHTSFAGRHFYVKRGPLYRHAHVRLPRDPRLRGRLVRVTISIVKP